MEVQHVYMIQAWRVIQSNKLSGPSKSGLTIVWGSRHSEDGILQSAAGVSSWSLVY